MPVLNAKEVRAATVAKGSRSPPPFINLTEVELRAALERNRDLPKYLTGGIPIREVPLVTDPAQRESVFLFKAPPTDRIGSSPYACHGADRPAVACWTRGIRSTAARATLC